MPSFESNDQVASLCMVTMAKKKEILRSLLLVRGEYLTSKLETSNA